MHNHVLVIAMLAVLWESLQLIRGGDWTRCLIDVSLFAILIAVSFPTCGILTTGVLCLHAVLGVTDMSSEWHRPAITASVIAFLALSRGTRYMWSQSELRLLCVIALSYILAHVSLYEAGHIVCAFGSLVSCRESEIGRMRTYFDTPVRARVRPGKQAKNLIYIIGESLEKQILGEFNGKGLNKSMPYLTELARNGTFCPNLFAAQYTQWTVGSMFVTTCGMPFIVISDTIEGNRARLLRNLSSFKCFGDVVRAAGYQAVMMSSGGTECGGMRRVLDEHGFIVRDKRHGLVKDWQLMEGVRKQLTSLVTDYRKQKLPFVLLITLEDTHPFYTVDHCIPRLNNSGPAKGMQAFDCTDQRIEQIMDMLKQHGLTPENTEVLIHGDHALMYSYKDFTVGTRWKKTLFAVFPFHRRRRIEKRITHYDLIPTVLDRMNIEYEPRFPFGRNIHEGLPSEPPSKWATDYLFSYFRFGPCNKTFCP